MRCSDYNHRRSLCARNIEGKLKTQTVATAPANCDSPAKTKFTKVAAEGLNVLRTPNRFAGPTISLSRRARMDT